MKNPDLCCIPGCRKEMWIFLEGRPYCAQHWHEESIRREKEAEAKYLKGEYENE